MRSSHGASSLALRGHSWSPGSDTASGPHQPSPKMDFLTHMGWPGSIRYLTLNRKRD